jgi:hypothetical protein
MTLCDRRVFRRRRDEIDEKLVEFGPEGRFEFVSAKTHSVVTTGTLDEILGVGDSDELTAQAETNLYGASGECGIDGFQPRSATRWQRRPTSCASLSGGRRPTSCSSAAGQ